MSIGPLGASRVGAIAPGGGRPPSGGTVVGTLAGRIAARLGEALDLGIDPDARRRPSLPARDAYDIGSLVAELADQIGALPADRARLEQALNQFAEQCAAAIAARPTAGTMAMIRAIIHAEGGDWTTADQALAAIGRIGAAVAGQARG